MHVHTMSCIATITSVGTYPCLYEYNQVKSFIFILRPRYPIYSPQIDITCQCVQYQCSEAWMKQNITLDFSQWIKIQGRVFYFGLIYLGYTFYVWVLPPLWWLTGAWKLLEANLNQVPWDQLLDIPSKGWGENTTSFFGLELSRLQGNFL